MIIWYRSTRSRWVSLYMVHIRSTLTKGMAANRAWTTNARVFNIFFQYLIRSFTSSSRQFDSYATLPISLYSLKCLENLKFYFKFPFMFISKKEKVNFINPIFIEIYLHPNEIGEPPQGFQILVMFD